MELGHDDYGRDQRDHSSCHELHGNILVGAWCVGGDRVTTTKIGQSGFQTVPNKGQGSDQTDDATGCYRTSTDIKHIRVAHIVWSHVGDWHGPWRNCAGNPLSEKFDCRDQDEV